MQDVNKRSNYLLVIGIDEYQDKMHGQLVNSVLDCQNLIKVLTNKYGFKLISDPLYNGSATRKNIIEKLGELIFLLQEEDNLIIYFAGHGSMNPHTNKGYWVPNDATYSESDYIPNSTIKDKIEDIKAKHIFLISDSCFSGTFLTRTRSANSESRFYKKLDKLKSRWYLSSGGEEKVLDGKAKEGSPFSNSLIKVLDDNSSKYLSTLEIVNSVSKLTGNDFNQQPIGGYITGVGHEFGQMILIIVDNFQYTDQQIKDLMKVYGFYYGQVFTTERIIQEYPQLKQIALLNQLMWESAFGSSYKSIIFKLQRIFGEKWNEDSEKLKLQLKELLSDQSIDFDEAVNFLEKLKFRSKGYMQSPIAETLLFSVPEFNINPVLEYIRGFKQKLASNETAKSKGLNFEMEVPMSWSIQEGKRPNVLWSIHSVRRGISLISTVHYITNIFGLDKNELEDIPFQDIANTLLTIEYLENSMSTFNPTDIKHKRVKIDGCEAATLECSCKVARLNVEIEYFLKSYHIVYNNYILVNSFQVVKDKMMLDMNEYYLFFDTIVNSLIIMNRYE